ncbi:hypothetical protein L596_018141 [Steinernema carpocapsae]|uniref:Protein-lysine N-methyltransferase L596_018141 n=1 Tax=Steinernema carpocapsae TaxID=34508 RepID=A0A4U5N3S9_STECR|nr:hypothetical protein L596_018141 [Steinernema carpocapsae]
MDDDFPTLPKDTLAILKQFMRERESVEAEGEAPEKISEDWQLSQFWYSEETTQRLTKECISALGPEGGQMACISCPTLVQDLIKEEAVKNGTVKVVLFEFDDRFGVKYPELFHKYDYRSPHAVEEKFRGCFDLIIADPPFLSDECLVKTAQTVRILSKDEKTRILLCTGAIMEEMAKRLLSTSRTKFEPKHANNLANDFACFANYATSTL